MKAWQGGGPFRSGHRPWSTSTPGNPASAATDSANLVLPIPASPETTTADPRPRTAPSTTLIRSPKYASLPIIGVPEKFSAPTYLGDSDPRVPSDDRPSVRDRIYW